MSPSVDDMIKRKLPSKKYPILRKEMVRLVFGRCRVAVYGFDTVRTTYIRPALLGAVDGLITSFVIVAGGLASNTDKRRILLIGFSSLIADGLSMGVSESISSRAQDGLAFRRAALLGFVCFASFIVIGCVPLVGFAIASSVTLARSLSIVFFGVMLFVVGGLRAWVTREACAWAVAETVVLGAAAGSVAYGIASIG